MHVSRLHFGSATALLEHGELHDDMVTALRSADGIGLPHPFRVKVKPDDLESTRKMRGIWGLAWPYLFLDRHGDELGVERKIGCDAEIHRSLFPHLRELVEGRDVGLVSCRDQLVVALQERLGAASVAFHRVPEQAMVKHAAAEQSTGHYPDRYRELRAKLATIAPGRLYLVGAGMPGKVYCHDIRVAGGVALDLGSALDVLAGRPARRNITEDVLDQWAIVPPISKRQHKRQRRNRQSP
jgi:hypothetical protein